MKIPASFAGKTTNWWDAGIRQFTPQLNASLGVQGGTEKNKYSVSLNYFQQDSFYQKGGYKRFTARFTNDYKFNKYFSAGFSLNRVMNHGGILLIGRTLTEWILLPPFLNLRMN